MNQSFYGLGIFFLALSIVCGFFRRISPILVGYQEFISGLALVDYQERALIFPRTYYIICRTLFLLQGIYSSITSKEHFDLLLHKAEQHQLLVTGQLGILSTRYAIKKGIHGLENGLVSISDFGSNPNDYLNH